MNVGFTGTRKGMTKDQRLAFATLISSLEPETFHHGDCVGADDQAANIVSAGMRNLGDVLIVCHPPVDAEHRAHNNHSDEVREPKTHFARNRDIVNETDVLIACPCEMADQPRGGTWYTISYAEKRGKATYIIWPDGRVEQRGAAK